MCLYAHVLTCGHKSLKYCLDMCASVYIWAHSHHIHVSRNSRCLCFCESRDIHSIEKLWLWFINWSEFCVCLFFVPPIFFRFPSVAYILFQIHSKVNILVFVGFQQYVFFLYQRGKSRERPTISVIDHSSGCCSCFKNKRPSNSIFSALFSFDTKFSFSRCNRVYVSCAAKIHHIHTVKTGEN